MSDLHTPEPYIPAALSQRDDDPRTYKHLHGSSRWAWIEHVHLWQPPTDLFETESAFIVRVEVAGMSQADFTVTLEEQTLRVGGIRQLIDSGIRERSMDECEPRMEERRRQHRQRPRRERFSPGAAAQALLIHT